MLSNNYNISSQHHCPKNTPMINIGEGVVCVDARHITASSWCFKWNDRRYLTKDCIDLFESIRPKFQHQITPDVKTLGRECDLFVHGDCTFCMLTRLAISDKFWYIFQMFRDKIKCFRFLTQFRSQGKHSFVIDSSGTRCPFQNENYSIRF